MHYHKFAFSKSYGLPTIKPLDPNAKIGQLHRLSQLDVMDVNIKYCPGMFHLSSRRL